MYIAKGYDSILSSLGHLSQQKGASMIISPSKDSGKILSTVFTDNGNTEYVVREWGICPDTEVSYVTVSRVVDGVVETAMSLPRSMFASHIV